MRISQRVAPWLAAMIPALIVLRFISATFYASPETDDFCFANHFNDDGLLRTVAIFYTSAIGRIVPIILITLPAMVSRATGVDMFVLYPMILTVTAIGFVSAVIFLAGRLWPSATKPQRMFVGIALAAVIFVTPISLREMLYWVPGTYSYLVPALIVMVMLVEMFRSAADRTAMSGLPLLAILCFLGAMCNEFTPLWLVGMIAGSFLFRVVTGHPYRQGRLHAILLAATLAGFAIVLLAPGNVIRMAEYSEGGKFMRSFAMGAYYAHLEWRWLLSEPAVLGWLGFVVIFSTFVAPSMIRYGRHDTVLLGCLLLLIIGCTFVGCFVGYYATGEDLATRGRNEMIVLMLTGLTCFAMLASRALENHVSIRGPAPVLAATIACGLLCLPLRDGRSMLLLNSEYAQFNQFRIESMNRNIFLKSVMGTDIVVPDRTVRPTVLMSADLTENPNHLPNDCVATYYGKTSVIMHSGF